MASCMVPCQCHGSAASRIDVVFGSNPRCALAEIYANDDAQKEYVRDFVAAWGRVMMLDRFNVT